MVNFDLLTEVVSSS